MNRSNKIIFKKTVQFSVEQVFLDRSVSALHLIISKKDILQSVSLTINSPPCTNKFIIPASLTFFEYFKLYSYIAKSIYFFLLFIQFRRTVKQVTVPSRAPTQKTGGFLDYYFPSIKQQLGQFLKPTYLITVFRLQSMNLRLSSVVPIIIVEWVYPTLFWYLIRCFGKTDRNRMQSLIFVASFHSLMLKHTDPFISLKMQIVSYSLQECVLRWQGISVKVSFLYLASLLIYSGFFTEKIVWMMTIMQEYVTMRELFESQTLITGICFGILVYTIICFFNPTSCSSFSTTRQISIQPSSYPINKYDITAFSFFCFLKITEEFVKHVIGEFIEQGILNYFLPLQQPLTNWKIKIIPLLPLTMMKIVYLSILLMTLQMRLGQYYEKLLFGSMIENIGERRGGYSQQQQGRLLIFELYFFN